MRLALQYFAIVVAYGAAAGLLMQEFTNKVPREYVFAGIFAWLVGFLVLTGYWADGKRGVGDMLYGAALWFGTAIIGSAVIVALILAVR
jgi:hypothetical protein